MKVCSECGSNWEETGTTGPRPSGSGKYYYCSHCQTRRKPIDVDNEIVEESVRNAKKLQAQRDKNRIERKAFREHARIENAYEEYVKNMDLSLKEISTKIIFEPPKPTEKVSDEIGLIQCSDWHLNELIQLKHNKFDIEIASKRVKLLADEAIRTFTARGITKVVVCFLGDLLNSDRRADEKYHEATNRAKASVVAEELVAKFLLHLASVFEEVSVTGVVGNEGRIDLDMSWSNDLASNNYDFTILANVRKIFQWANIPVTFGPIDKIEEVIEINGHRLLTTHDITTKTKEQKGAQSVIGKYYLSDNPVDCIITGHIHATKITVLVARNGSLPGSNEFNENGLGLIGRASQNIAVFGKGYRNFMAVDLQNVDNVEGYDLVDDMMAYNAKSAEKLIDRTVTFKVVI